MKDEMQRYLKTIEVSKEINKQANQLIKNNSYSDFTRVQLRMIADLSARKSIEANREARKCLGEWESELAGCKKMYDERHQPLHEEALQLDEDKEEELESR